MEISGKRLVLVLWGKDSDGADEVSAHAGTVRKTSAGFVLERGADQPPIDLRPEWLNRVRPVPENLRSVLLDADFQIPLTVGSLPEGADTSAYVQLGIRIPPKSSST